VNYIVADIATNQGVTGVIWLMEMATGRFPLTGKFDDALLAGISLPNDQATIIEILSMGWITSKRCSGEWSLYGHGWSNRRNTSRSIALGMLPQEPSS
jgi:hypothetical protein